ncbi:hypothetical protein IFM5058_10283 [Aspergillus udagawae]|nr:hypothetical protein IFM5058_10283 [Aspergillus udagawae]
MGITESKIFIDRLNASREEAEKEDKHELDPSFLFQDEFGGDCRKKEVIQKDLRAFTDAGQRYRSISNELGGPGILFFLPEKGESNWFAKLPKGDTPSAKENRSAVLKELRDGGIASVADLLKAHCAAEKILGNYMEAFRSMLSCVYGVNPADLMGLSLEDSSVATQSGTRAVAASSHTIAVNNNFERSRKHRLPGANRVTKTQSKANQKKSSPVGCRVRSSRILAPMEAQILQAQKDHQSIQAVQSGLQEQSCSVQQDGSPCGAVGYYEHYPAPYGVNPLPPSNPGLKRSSSSSIIERRHGSGLEHSSAESGEKSRNSRLLQPWEPDSCMEQLEHLLNQGQSLALDPVNFLDFLPNATPAQSLALDPVASLDFLPISMPIQTLALDPVDFLDFLPDST